MLGEKKRNLGVLVALIVAVTMIIPGTLTIASELSQVESNIVVEDYYQIKFKELPTDGIRSELSAAFNMIFSEYRQDNTYLVRIPIARVAQLSACPLVSNLAIYSPNQKISTELKSATGYVSLRIDLHKNTDVQATVSILEGMDATVTTTRDVIANYIEASIDASMISSIAGLKQVYSVQPNGEKQTHMNYITQNAYTGVDAAQVGGFTGSGMLAEVQDNGCDLLHPDLTGVDYTDGTVVADSHGTCTTGIVFGTGAGDINAQGIAYQATGVFCDWDKGRTASIQRLWTGTFNEGSAGKNGVVQSNSWSIGALDGSYSSYTAEDDAAIVAYPKVLSLWAAGNANDGTGIGLITQDSANKNGMCIGAIFHQNTAALADDDYHDAGSGMTPSRGPAADGRMKPDLIAAFDWIYTVDQRAAAGYTGTNYYDDFGGTSGATPTVAGCAVQTYEMYQENFFDNNPTNAIPYSDTIKALMIADAYQYPIGVNAITRNVEGWGAPDMENMYTLGADYHVITEHPQAMSSGSIWSRQAYSDGTKPLKITLAWIDPAAPGTTGTGRALINNLDLHVTSPGGTEYWGNMGLWSNLWSVSGTGTNDWTRTAPTYTDDENNVENVFVLAPQVGMWTIEVQGATGDVAQGPQQFSVVASGAMGISSIGSIALNKNEYVIPDTAQVTVQDLDLNTVPTTIQTVNINIASTSEPAGETLLLTETGVDTSTFVNTIPLSSTNSAGVLWVAHGNTITATYMDASPSATRTDTATVDAQVLSATGLTVDWYGTPTKTWINEGFGTFPPTGWQIATTGTTGSWSGSASVLAGGTSPEAHFVYGVTGTGTSRFYTGPFNTTGRTVLDLQFRQFFDAYGTGVTVKVQTSTNGVTWADTGWSIIGGTVNVGPNLITKSISTAEGAGSATFYVAWVVDGNSYQLDNWYIDSVLMTSSGESITADNWLNWTKSGDDGAGANDVVQYNIYRANNAGGPWIPAAIVQTVSKGIATWTDSMRGQPDGINWYYVVRAVDDAGNIDTNTNAVPEMAAGTYATATGPLGTSNVVAVTLTYSWSGTPTSVNIYYTKNGGTSWTLAGNDVTVNGNFAYTIAAGDGTYGWLASAVGGGSTELSPPTAGTAPEAASYILDGTPPTPPATFTVQRYGTTVTPPPTVTVQGFQGTLGTVTAEATCVLNAPTGITIGEVLLLIIGTDHNVAGPQFNALAGWTQAGEAGSATPDAFIGAYWRIADGTEGATVTVTLATAANWVGWYIRISGADTVTPIDVQNFAISTAAGALIHNIPQVTTTVNNCLVFYGLSWDGGDGPAFSVGAPWTESAEATIDGAAATASGCWGTKLQATAGATGNAVVTSTSAGGADGASYFQIAIHPAAGSVIGQTLDNTLNWTASASGDVDHYNIYRSAAGTDAAYSLLTTVPVGTLTYCDVSRGSADGTLWWYYVTAVDTATNEGIGTTHRQEPGATPPYSIPLTGKAANSWVFVSFPSAMSGNIQTILNDATAGDSGTTWTVAKWFNIQDKADPWKTYRVGSAVNDMPTLTNTMGVWLWITANGGDQKLTLSSYVTNSSVNVVVNLYTGWNLVGYPTATSRAETATLPAQADFVASWQIASPYITQHAKGATLMVPGNAYWVHTTADTTWTVVP